ncbi:DUF1853 family protein [Rubritalea spongiae]|uniref:DUF1853 family protein n=2 Tax=Rubritalea spongiae TaxID=430797 RepID=A0ABW5E0H4_9BACT
MLGDLPNSSTFSLQQTSLPTPTPSLKFNQKLGHLYEDALAELLQASETYKLITTNLQLITPEKQTLGELDFILWNKKNHRCIHLELAVKFYLIHSHNDQLHYPGPDARDDYQRKLERLTSHQLTLTQQDKTRALMSQFTDMGPIKVQHLVHGIFFAHISTPNSPLPPHASPQVRRRPWLYCHELKKVQSSSEPIKIIPKQLWLCEITPELFDALVTVSFDELSDLAQQRCTMWTNSPGSTPHFLVPDTWPQHRK